MVRHDLDLLETCVGRDGFAIVYPLPEVLNKAAIVKFSCSCEHAIESSKTLGMIHKSGGFCPACTQSNSVRKRLETGVTLQDETFLEACAERDNFTIVRPLPKKITRDIEIQFVCSCGAYHSKVLRWIGHSGGFCGPCTLIHTNLKKKESNKYSKNMLELCAQRDGFELVLPLPGDLVQDSRIQFTCSCGKACEKTFNCILNFGKGFCTECTRIHTTEKTIQTCMEKYGTNFPGQNDEVKEKQALTNIERYGSRNALSNPDVQAKAKETLMRRYGVEFCMQVPEIAERASSSAFRSKTYTFPSGKQVQLHGFEPQALDILMKECIPEENNFTSKAEVPEVHYFNENGYRRYYVDIFMPPRRMIEVKSIWYLQKDYLTNIQKHKACLYLGYDHQIWVLNDQGAILKIIGGGEIYGKNKL